MKKALKSLIGFEGSLLELSNKLQVCGYEDIGYFGCMDSIIDDGSMVVSESDNYEQHIILDFDVIYKANMDDENILATIIKITNIKDFYI